MPKFRFKTDVGTLTQLKTAAEFVGVSLDDEINSVADEAYVTGSVPRAGALYELGSLHQRMVDSDGKKDK